MAHFFLGTTTCLTAAAFFAAGDAFSPFLTERTKVGGFVQLSSTAEVAVTEQPRDLLESLGRRWMVSIMMTFGHFLCKKTYLWRLGTVIEQQLGTGDFFFYQMIHLLYPWISRIRGYLCHWGRSLALPTPTVEDSWCILEFLTGWTWWVHQIYPKHPENRSDMPRYWDFVVSGIMKFQKHHEKSISYIAQPQNMTWYSSWDVLLAAYQWDPL